MSNRDDLSRLQDMINAIDKIDRYTDDIDFDTFQENEMIQDAIFKNFEIIGEAAYRLSQDLKAKFNEVEWQKIEGLRHKLVHDYYRVDLEIVWQTRDKNLPLLKSAIKNILRIETNKK